MGDLLSPLTPGSGSVSINSSEEDETRSLPESVRQYNYYNGRRYHSYRSGSYKWPNDEIEMERMDRQFHVFKAAQNGEMFFAPVKEQDARHVLDVGTGTGIWPILLADMGRFPNAKITGIDLSPIQPQDIPESVVFEVQDASDLDWVRPLDSISLVYCQSLMGSLSDYSSVIRTARRYLCPGEGWIETCELDPLAFADDDTLPVDYSFNAWALTMFDASERIGRPLRVAPRLKQWMIDAGYVDVQETISKIPIGSWPARRELKRVGRAMMDVVDSTLSVASAVVLEEAYGWSPERSELFCVNARRDLRNKKIHAYTKLYTVYGRKPSREEEQAMAQRMAPPPRPSRSEVS